ncbi:MAG TPA: hypothetical protein DIC52_19750 [Candidatus Latescibacteria bacterium]|nr:hypothetical protein [Candidatus Latescibacterota bacterium]
MGKANTGRPQIRAWGRLRDRYAAYLNSISFRVSVCIPVCNRYRYIPDASILPSSSRPKRQFQPSMANLGKICGILQCQPGDLLHFVNDGDDTDE